MLVIMMSSHFQSFHNPNLTRLHKFNSGKIGQTLYLRVHQIVFTIQASQSESVGTLETRYVDVVTIWHFKCSALLNLWHLRLTVKRLTKCQGVISIWSTSARWEVRGDVCASAHQQVCLFDFL